MDTEGEDAEEGPQPTLPSAAGQAESLAFAQAGDSDEARAYLRTARRMMGLQMEHLHEQRALALSHLRLRRFTDRLKVATQIFIVCVAGGIVVLLAVMIHDAFSSQSVIVEPFDAPPALAARGLSGKGIASALLDQLTRLQAASRGTAARRELSNAWTNDIKVQVPETGVSIGEINRLLRARFGHDLHLEGDLVLSDTGGLILTVRGDGLLPKSFTGKSGDLQLLTNSAAEYIYGQSEPSLYATYLLDSGRDADAVAFSKAAFATAPLSERPFLLNAWANALGNLGAPPQQAMSLYRAALALKPDYWVAYNNVMNAALAMGDEEGAWQAGEAMRRAAGGRPGQAQELYYGNWDLLTWNLQAWRAATVADAESHHGVGTLTNSVAPAIADIDVRLHDAADAELQLQTAQADASDRTVEALTHFVHGRIAAETGDNARAAAEMEAFGAVFADPVVSSDYPGYDCWIAPAQEAAGHPERADATLKSAGHFVDCYRFRADILDGRGHWAEAQRAYADAVALAPDLPAAYYSWGAALARHGDADGAMAKLALANARGPHWADPLKLWGDMLARQGRWVEAAAKYDAALVFAPQWSALRAARAAAAARQ
jgi:tetratricopeptide (TPR) repeat protein